MTDLVEAKKAARYFGAEAVANGNEFSNDDRWSIAWYYYGQKPNRNMWSSISVEHREILVAEFRSGEEAERKHHQE